MEEIIQTELLYPEIIWERPVHYYKSKAGKILIIAGGSSNPQKAIIACETVFRSGTGVLILGFPETLKDIYKDMLPNTMTLPLPATFGGSLSQKSEPLIIEQVKACDVALIGPGLSNNAETIHLIWNILFEINIPIVLSEDGISALIKGIEVIRAKEDEAFLIDFFHKKTGELILILSESEVLKILLSSRLSELPKPNIEYVKKHKKEIAQILATNLNAIIVIQGVDAIIASGNKIIINKKGTIETSVVPGIVTSFIGQNPDKIFESIATAVYLHGATEEIAKEKIGSRPILPSDIIRYLPEAIKKLENH